MRFPDCKETHGAHQETGQPLGIPADRETRAARIEAHDAFDTWRRKRGLKRKDAYRWLAKTMGLSKHKAHIAKMTKAQCEQLIVYVMTDTEI